jgi:hypothetical protein
MCPGNGVREFYNRTLVRYVNICLLTPEKYQ